MPTINDLLARRARTWDEYQEALGRGDENGYNAETREKLDRLEADIASMTGDIGRLERAASMDEAFAAVNRENVPDTTTPPTASAEKSQGEAFAAYLRGGVAGMSPEQRQSLQGSFVAATELRAAGVATGAAGGFTVPQGFRDQIIETMKAWGNVATVAEVINTTEGNALPWPTNDDTANEGAILAENTQVAEQDVTFGQAQLGAFMYTSKLIRVSYQLLQDSAFDLETWLARKLGERLARITNRHYTVGTGAGAQPVGIQPTATSGVTLPNGNTTSATYDGYIDLIHSVDPAYRQSGRARFMLHDSALAAARKIKDSQNRPLWEPSIANGVPDTLLGYPLSINQHLPAPAAGTKSVLFGDFFAGYVVRNVLGIQMLRLEERYADFLQVGFLGFLRSDATIQDASAYKAMTQSAV